MRDITRRAFASGAAAFALAASAPLIADEKPKIAIYKSPTCDCCQKWADHLSAAGFATDVIDRGSLTALKTEWGVPTALRSCHMGKIDGYVIEGHVPAAAIKRLLAERPQAVGLAVPGMPIGSPGMEGGKPEIYNVVLFGAAGETVFGRFQGENELSK
ncbi:MAG: DUF411 domain-containing protein [Hyphomicrobiales bacterium]|nr:DUF411 domain-containing protein [Hyphomicrobiales bacterium]